MESTAMKRSPLLLLVFALACADVPVDEFEGLGGTAPEPTGVLRGTVLYSGPKPLCGEDGAPLGNVILTLFEYDNPPPPTGTATSAANLLTIPGISLFSGSEDCLMEGDDPRESLTRTAEFAWPELPLGHDYQIRGFYDYDGNFNPFFSVTNLPTQGDIAGGAFVDPNATLRQFRRLSFDSEEEAPNGQVINGVSVALGAPVSTERPVFYMESDPLDSAATLPLTDDPVLRENMILALTNTTLNLYDAEKDGASFDHLAQAFASAGMPLDEPEGFAIGDTVSNYPHAWYLREVDADGDGRRDLHPILGAAGVNWLTPIVLMVRAQTPVEIEAGIPGVAIVPTVSNVQYYAQGRRAFDDSIQIGVPPIAAVTLNPADARCQIPYIPPGNTTSTYERITVECQEVPSARYAVNVVHGFAGAGPVGVSEGEFRMCTPPDELPDDVEPPPFLAADGCFDYPNVPPDSGRIESCNADNECAIPPFRNPDGNWELEGGSLSGQAWGIPNALGDPNELPMVHSDEAASATLVAEQGIGGMFLVQDSDGTDVGTDAACAEAIDDEDPPNTRPVEYKLWDEYGDDAEALQCDCCRPVRHLCNIDLCPVDEDTMLRGSPTSVDDGNRPNCVPFEIPDICCIAEAEWNAKCGGAGADVP
jgi:hypothetical protein